MDRHRSRIEAIFSETYGRDQVTKWIVRWRTFFMACSELWGYRDGNEWLVSHYLFRPHAVRAHLETYPLAAEQMA